MRNSIAVMNTKGGVGKSTIIMAIAETASTYFGKSVLVIDSDAQASASSMLMAVAELHQRQVEGLTIVDYLASRVLHGQDCDWLRFIAPGVSDVDDARTISLLPSDMQLTLFERSVSKENLHGELRRAVNELLTEACRAYDLVLIDCPPGLSVLTESWLREADFYISPTKADYVSVCGLEVFHRFKMLNPEMGFAENIGVLINMKETGAARTEEYEAWLREKADNWCFETALPRSAPFQDASRFNNQGRSYLAKYPGSNGQILRALMSELIQRMSDPANLMARLEARAAMPSTE